MMRRSRTLLVLFALSLAGHAEAQSYGTELPFVLGTSTRAAGLGVAGMTLRGDASVQYYNPSALTYLEWKEFAFYRTRLFDSQTTYNAICYAHPLMNYGTIGISILRLGVGGIEERDDGNQLLNTDLQNTQTRILLGYGKNITSTIGGGFNLKVDRQSLGTYSGSGIGLDVGISATQYLTSNSFIKGFRQGFVIQNLIEPSVKLDQETVPDPMQIGLGVAMLSSYRGATFETFFDLVSPRYSPFTVYFGQEISYANRFSARIGVDDQSMAYGFGARYRTVSFDYAYRSLDIGNNHRFSLSVRFGASVSEQRARARSAMERQVNDKIVQGMDQLERTQIAVALDKGDSLYALERYSQALNHYESALLWDPDNQHAIESSTNCQYHRLMDQGASAILDEDYLLGLFYSKQALELAPNDSKARAQADLCEDKIAEAENRSELLTSLLKKSIELYAERDYARALAGFDEVLLLDPSSELGGEYRNKCLVHIDELVQRHLADARRLADGGDYDGATELLDTALEQRPEDAAVRDEIAGVRERMEASVKAAEAPLLSERVAAVQTRPDVDPVLLEKNYDRGMESFRAGDFDRAVRLLTEVWTADPDFHDVSNLLTKAYLYIGIRFYSEDQYDKATDIWKKVLNVDPQNAKAKRYLRKTEDEVKKIEQVYDG